MAGFLLVPTMDAGSADDGADKEEAGHSKTSAERIHSCLGPLKPARTLLGYLVLVDWDWLMLESLRHDPLAVHNSLAYVLHDNI
jgi:hypothetical protein